MQYSIALFHFSFGVPQSMNKEWFFNIYSWCSNFRIITDVTQVHGNKITVVLSIYMCTMYCINMVQTGAITSIISYNNIHISPRILKNQTSLWKVSCQVPQCSAASFGHVVDTLFFNNWIVRPIWLFLIYCVVRLGISISHHSCISDTQFLHRTLKQHHCTDCLHAARWACGLQAWKT